MRKILLISALILIAASLIPSSGFCQDKLVVRAKIWNYGTICEFADPPHSSGFNIKATSDKTTLEVTDCKTFEKKSGHPVAVTVELKNEGAAVLDVPIEKDLTNVKIAPKDGQAVPAIAKRAMVEGPMGGTKMEFVTKADASYLLKLEAGQAVNIVYLFPKAAAGDTVTVSKLKPAKIE